MVIIFFKIRVTRISLQKYYEVIKIYGSKFMGKRMAEVKKQGMEHHTITKEALIKHYEYHIISLERAVMEDIRLCKQMMQTLERKIVTRDGLDSMALNQWKGLSNHKIKLLNKIKHIKRPMKVELNKSYEFSS